jgi:hypothetical protein
MPNRSVIQRLRRQLAAPPAGVSRAVWSSGVPCIDEMLPEGGFRSGSLVEWLGESGSGVSTLAWRMAAHWQSSRSVIVVDPGRECFPPGVANLGVDLRRVLVLQPNSPTETLWSLEQSLRTGGRAGTLSAAAAVSPRPHVGRCAFCVRRRGRSAGRAISTRTFAGVAVASAAGGVAARSRGKFSATDPSDQHR